MAHTLNIVVYIIEYAQKRNIEGIELEMRMQMAKNMQIRQLFRFFWVSKMRWNELNYWVICTRTRMSNTLDNVTFLVSLCLFLPNTRINRISSAFSFTIWRS